MKHIQALLKPPFIFLFATFCCIHSAKAQDSKKSKDSAKATATKPLVESKQFIFNVESVTPMKGGTRNLSPGYSLKIKQDTIVSELPYFGRAYQASLSSTEGGIKFTSIDFDYTVKDRKKGGWDITIKPKDAGSVQELTLTVFDNANANLNVTANDRQPISFRGYIEAIIKP